MRLSSTSGNDEGGIGVALDALMRERGGVWIAHGSGDAERLVVDANDGVMVPPGYPLRRIWLTAGETESYYEGFANEGLWPLCHVAHVCPVFRPRDWKTYQKINAQFAAAIEQEFPDPSTPVFIQDYHLALVAASLRKRCSQVKSALFWHIPWSHPDRLRLCQWRREIMEGLLANDLLAFQIELGRRNFVTAARDELGAEVTRSTVRHKGRLTLVQAVPIGVDYDRSQQMTTDHSLEADTKRLVAERKIDPESTLGLRLL